ncbi:MAG: hypothetical protein ABI720_04705 [Actinomycetes bacterium]
MGKQWVLAALTAFGLCVGAFAASPVSAAEVSPDTVSGHLYRDLDNDGVRDFDEPPVTDVVIRSGRRSTITDADGYYAFTNLTSPVNVRVDTGWFRSQCTSSYSGPSSGAEHTAECPDPGFGAGPDQDFRVVNQLISATGTPGAEASLGLTPDWMGNGYSGFSTAPGDATTVDPALRLSPGYRMPGAAADCVKYVCRPGETQWVLVQWLNQGTDPLVAMKGVVRAPKGSMITQVTPYLGHGKSSGQTVTGFAVKDTKTGQRLSKGSNGTLSSPAKRIRVSLRGVVPAGAEYLTSVAFRMNDDATFSDGNGDGTPDCSAATGGPNPGQVCSLATDSSPGSYIAYGAIVRVKDAIDSDAQPCPKVPRNCPALGVHDKTKPGDSNDAGAWKVDSRYPPA